jgi:hypothetical protein
MRVKSPNSDYYSSLTHGNPQHAKGKKNPALNSNAGVLWRGTRYRYVRGFQLVAINSAGAGACPKFQLLDGVSIGFATFLELEAPARSTALPSLRLWRSLKASGF